MFIIPGTSRETIRRPHHREPPAPVKGDGSEMDLIHLLRTDPVAGWERFVRDYTPVILRSIALLIDDDDERMDVYLYVLQKLAEENGRRLLAYGDGDGDKLCSFPTWLKLITRNLTIDSIRSRLGRRTMPRAIGALPPLSRKIFVLVYWDGLSYAEVIETLNSRYGIQMRMRDFAPHIRSIEESLTSVYRTNLAHDYHFRRQAPLSFDEDEMRDIIESRVPIGFTPASPDRWVELAQIRERYLAALERLAPEERKIARLRFEDGKTAREIAGEIGMEHYKSVYPRIARITKLLRKEMNYEN